MRLNAGAVREMHWHKEGEWAYMLKGRARITAVDHNLCTFQDDVGEGEGWFFPAGIPHSDQGLGDDGCEFLLVFDSGAFDENETFLLTDFLSCIPKEILAKNFNVPEAPLLEFLPRSSTYSPPSYPLHWKRPSRRPGPHSGGLHPPSHQEGPTAHEVWVGPGSGFDSISTVDHRRRTGGG